MKILVDNTAAIKAASVDYDVMAGYYEKVEPIKPFAKPLVSKGQVLYNVNGRVPGKVQKVDGPDVLINNTWSRLEDWSPEPWSLEAKAAYNLHRLNESNRVHSEILKVTLFMGGRNGGKTLLWRANK